MAQCSDVDGVGVADELEEVALQTGAFRGWCGLWVLLSRVWISFSDFKVFTSYPGISFSVGAYGGGGMECVFDSAMLYKHKGKRGAKHTHGEHSHPLKL